MVNLVKRITGTGMPVEVIGLHVLASTGGPEGTNSGMWSGKAAPWVRENATFQPYLDWRLPVAGRTTVQWRDVVVVNQLGAYAAVQNLSSTPLGSSDTNANNAALRSILLAQANQYNADLDADGLPTTWETEQFSTQVQNASGDPFGVGRAALLSYAFGLGVREQGQPMVQEVTVAGRKYFQMTYRRLTGLRGYAQGTTPAQLSYTPQIYSSSTGTWSSAAWTPVSDTDPFDGKGTRVIVARTPVPHDGTGAPRSQMVRLRVSRN